MNKTDNDKIYGIQRDKQHSTEISVNICELILTPLTCASIIGEIIKCLLYQKSQIPYPYNWFSNVINRRRRNLGNKVKPLNFTVERHYHIASAAYDALEGLIKNLQEQFQNYSSNIQEVLIVFGSTVYTSKEVFRIRIPRLAKGHLENNHLHSNSKNQYKILKNIVFTEEWIKAMESSIPPTNMFVMLQKYCDDIQRTEENFFLPNLKYTSPSDRIKSTVINLEYNDNNMYNCCENLSIFEDAPNEKTETDSQLLKDYSDCIDQSSNLLWFQAEVVLKGFKECFVNNISATELW